MNNSGNKHVHINFPTSVLAADTAFLKLQIASLLATNRFPVGKQITVDSVCEFRVVRRNRQVQACCDQPSIGFDFLQTAIIPFEHIFDALYVVLGCSILILTLQVKLVQGGRTGVPQPCIFLVQN